jgi:hypothetical protein
VQQEQQEGRESRQRVLDYLLEYLTSPNSPMTVEQQNEFSALLFFLEPEIGKQLDRLKRVYQDEKPDIYKALLLATAVRCLNLALESPPPAEPARKVKSATVAVVPS